MLIIFFFSSFSFGDGVDSIDPIGDVGGTYQAKYIRDLGGIAQISFSGNLDVSSLEGGSKSFEPRAIIAREFFETHLDNYDFLVVISDFDYEMPENTAAFYMGAKNEITGIRRPVFDNTKSWGSNGRFRGYIDFHSVNDWELDPNKDDFFWTMTTLSHEIMHAWGGGALYKDDNGEINSGLIGSGSHWNALLDSSGSVMYGHRWLSLGGGQYKALEPTLAYSPLDLYLAGFYQEKEVPNFTLYESEDTGNTDKRINGTTISVTGSESISIEQIVSAEGERIPSAENAQNSFNIALILLTSNENYPSSKTLLGLNNIRENFKNTFTQMTAGRAVLNFHAEEFKNKEKVEEDTLLASLNVDSAIDWLLSQQTIIGFWQGPEGQRVRNTSISASILSTLLGSEDYNPQPANNWLSSIESIKNIEDASSLMGFNEKAKQYLINNRSDEGSWGIADGYNGSVLDTATVLISAPWLKNKSSIDYLNNSQNPDGGWSIVPNGNSSPNVTAKVLEALMSCGELGQDQLSLAVNFIASKQTADGSFNIESMHSVLETASIINSLVKVNRLSAIEFSAALSFIERNQMENGSWKNDAYTTAYIVNVFKDVQLPNLAFNHIELDEVNVGVGSTVTITLEINNIGVASSTPVEVSLHNGDEIIATQELPSLSQNQGVELSFSLNVGEVSGAKRISLIIDKNRSLVEKTKVDNETFVDIMVLERPEGVDLSIENAEIISPLEIKTLPNTLQLAFEIKNLGGSDSKSAQLMVYTMIDGNKSILTETSLVIDSLESVSKSIDVLLESSQTSELIVEVIDNDGLDSIEFNNYKIIKIPFKNGVDYQIFASEITTSDAPHIVNNDIQFSSRVWNKGVAAAPNTEVIYSIKNASGIVEVARFPFFLNSNEYKEHNFTWTPSEAGDYQLIAVVDSENLISEINESNNSASKTFSVSLEEGANLSISYKDILIQQDVVNESESLIASVSVWNKGVETTDPAQVSLYLGNPNNDGILLDTRDVPSMVSGSSQVVDLTWNNINVSEKHTIYVYIDPLNVISESNELDNIGFIEIDIEPVSDLSISDGAVSLNPAILFEDSEAILSFDILNLGGQTVTDLSIKLSVNGKELDTLTGLKIDSYSKESFQYPFVVKSEYSGKDIQIELDPLKRIVERNENNNVAIYPILLSDSSFYVTERYISPNGDGVQDSTNIFYRADDSGSIKLTISKDNGDIVISNSALPSSGYIKWTGKDGLGYLQNDGEYTVSVIDEASGVILNTAIIEIDTNRSTISDAIGTEFGEVINLSDNLGGLELRSHVYTYDNDQKIYFISDEWLYRANYDGSNKEILAEGIYGEIIQDDGDWLLIEKSNNYDLNNYSLFNAVTKETIELIDLIPSTSSYKKFVSLYFTSKNIIRLLIVENNDEDSIKIYEINLNDKSLTIISNLDQEIVDIYNLQVFSTRNGGIGYVRNEDQSLLGNLITGEIRLLSFMPLNVDEETQEILGFSTSDKKLVLSDYLGNIKDTILVGLERIDYALFDGKRKTAVLIENSNRFWGCGGQLNGGLIDGSELDPDLGGTYVVDLNSQATQKIANVTQANYGECIHKEGLPVFQEYDSKYSDLLNINGYPLSVIDGAMIDNRTVDDSYYGILKDGYFIDNSDYILSPDFILNNAPSLIDKVDENLYSQSTGLIQFKLNGSYEDTSLLFNDRRIESVEVSNYEQYLVLTERVTADKYDYSLFRSLMNLSVGINATYNSKNQVIDVNVLAADKNFEYYQLFYRQVGEKEWTSLVEPRSLQVLGEDVYAWIPPEEGIYTIKLVAYDKAGNVKEITTNVPWGRSNPITSIRIDKEIFSPNSDGIKDNLEISYAVNRPYNLEIQFRNEEGQLVREESIQHEVASLHQTFNWDGLDQFGSKLPDGRYTVTVDGVDFFTYLDSTLPRLISQCTDYLMNSLDKLKETQEYFDSKLCVELEDDFLDEVNIYRKLAIGNWQYYRKATLGDDKKYLLEISNYSDYLDYEYQLRANDLAGNLLVDSLDIEKKLNYFRFIGKDLIPDVPTLSTPPLSYYNYKNIVPGSNNENEVVNLKDSTYLKLLNSYSDEDIEYQISLDGNSWDTIHLNSEYYSTDLSVDIFLNSSSISSGNILRAVLHRDNEIIISNEITIIDNDLFSSRVEINEINETKALIDLDNDYNNQIRIEIFSLDDERYLQPINIYEGDLELVKTRSITTDLINVDLCTAYKFNIFEDEVLRETLTIKSPCIALSVESHANESAQCNSISESLDMSVFIQSKSSETINSSVVELFVNGQSEGFIYTNLDPLIYEEIGEKYKNINSFILDTSKFDQGDSVWLDFSITTDEGEVIVSTYEVPVDKDIPVFTQSRPEKNCAIQVGNKSYYGLKGQLLDVNKSQIEHELAYGLSSYSDYIPLNTYASKSLDLIPYICNKYPINSQLRDQCRIQSGQIIEAIVEEKSNESLYLKQGLIDFIEINEAVVDSYFHAFDQSGNHACVKVSDYVDFEIEGIEISLENRIQDEFYYFSTSEKADLREVLTIQADESVSVTIKLAELNKLNARGEDLFTVYEGEYTSGILSLDSDDFKYPDGRYKLYIQVIDSCGITETFEFNVVLDSIDPFVVLDNPISNEIRSITDLFGTISDVNLSDYSIQFKSSLFNTWITLEESNNEKSIINALLYRWDVNDLTGNYDLKIQARDKAGNTSSLVKTFSVLKDQAILVNFELENRYISTLNEDGLIDFIIETNEDVIGSILINDNVVFTTSMKSGINKVLVPVSALSDIEDGIYTAEVQVYEEAEPSIIETLDIKVIFDSTKVEIKFAESDEEPNGLFDISWVDTNHSQTDVKIRDKQTGQIFAYSYTDNSKESYDLTQFEVAEGFFNFLVTSYDLAGNENLLDKTILFDLESPVLALKTPISKFINQKDQSLSIEFVVDDAFLEGVKIYVDELTVYDESIEKGDVILADIDLSDLNDGSITLKIEAFDQAGNQAFIVEKVILDSILPELDMDNSIWNIGSNQKIAFQYIEENIDRVEIQFDNQDVYTLYRQNQGTISWPNLIPDGEYNLELKAFDLAGNEKKDSVLVSRDTQPPEAVVNLAHRIVDTTSVELTWLSSTSPDIASYKLYRNEALIAESEENVYLDENMPNGVYSYRVTALDHFGNESESSNKVDVVVDTIPPSIEFTSLADGQSVSGIVPINLTIPDSDLESFSVILKTLEGTETLLAQGNLPIFNYQVALLDTVSLDTNLEVKVEAQDISGNTASSAVSITVDNNSPIAPSISASLDVDVLTLDVTQLDSNASGFSIYRNDKLIETLSQLTLESWSETLVDDGFYTYYLVQHSNANVPSKPSNIEQVYLDLSAPRFEILSPLTDGLYELELSVDIKYLDKDIDTISINIFDESKSVLQVSKDLDEAIENTTIDISNLQYENYVLSVTVTDLTGNAVTEEVAFTVADITAPDPIDSFNWRTYEGKLFISWEYDSEKIVQQDVASFHIEVYDGYGDFIASAEANNQDRETVFTLGEGMYSTGIYVTDTEGNESLIKLRDDIEIIEPNIITPYTPDVLNQKSLTFLSEFSGGLWVEKNDQVVSSQTVEIAELIEVPLVLEEGVNRFKVYGDYDENITIPVFIDLILSSYPEVSGTAIYDSQLETISINRQPEANEYGYLLFDEQKTIQDIAPSSASNSSLVDGNFSSYVYIYDDIGEYEILYQKQELLLGIDIAYPSESWAPEKVVLEAWTGSNWIQLPHSNVENVDGATLLLDKPYLTNKVKLTFYKPSYQYRIQIYEITTLTHKVFTGSEINTSLINFENQSPYLRIVNKHGIVSEGRIDVADLQEALIAPTVSATVEDSDVTVSFNLPSDAVSVHLFRNGIDIGTYVNTENIYVDTDLKNGQYTYYAISYDGLGNRSPMSTHVSVDIYKTKITKPENLEADQDQGSIRLSWSSVEEALSYQIYRKTTLSDQWIELGIAQQPEYLDASVFKGTPYMYKVAGIDEIGNIGEDSNFVTALIQSDEELVAPNIISPQTNTLHQDSVKLSIKSEGVSVLGVNLNGSSAGVFPVNENITDSMSISALGYINYSGTISSYVDQNRKIKSIVSNEGGTILTSTPRYSAAFDGGSYFSDRYQISRYLNDSADVETLNTGNAYHYSLSSSLDGNTVVYNERYALWAYDVAKSEKQLIDSYYYSYFDLEKTAVDLTGLRIAYIRSSELYVSTRQADGTFLKGLVPDIEYDSIHGLAWLDSELVVLYSLDNSYYLRKLNLISNQWSEAVSISLSNVNLVGIFEGSIVLNGSNESGQYHLASYQSDLILEWLLPSPFANTGINLTSSGNLCGTESSYWSCFALPGLTIVTIPIENGSSNVISAYGISDSGLYSEESNFINVLSDKEEFINASVSLQDISNSDSGLVTFIASINMLSGSFLESSELNILLVSENGDVLIDDYAIISALSEGEEVKLTFSFTPEADTSYVAKITLLQADSDNTDNTEIHKFYIAEPNESNPSIKITQNEELLELRVVNVDGISDYQVSLDIENNGNIESFLWSVQDISNQLVTLSLSDLAMFGNLEAQANLIDNEQVLDTYSLTIIREDQTSLTGELQLPSLVMGSQISISASIFGDVINEYFNGSYALTLMDENASVLETTVGTINWLTQDDVHNISQVFNLSSIENGNYTAKLSVTNINGDLMFERIRAFSKQNFSISLLLDNKEVTVPTTSSAVLPFKLEGVLANYIENLTLSLETTDQNHHQSYVIGSLPFDGIFGFEGLNQVTEIEGKVILAYQVNIDGNIFQERSILDTVRISVVDVTPPSLIAITPNHNGFINQEKSIKLQVMDTDNSSVRVEFSQNEINRSFDAVNGVIDIPSSILKYGKNAFDFNLIDEFNNTAEIAAYSVIYDDISPAIEIVSTANEMFSKSPFTIRKTVDDDYLESSTVTLNGNVVTEDEVLITEDGDYRYEVFAVDKAGNKSVNAMQRILDQTAPVLQVDGVQHEMIINQDITFSIKAIEQNIERFEVTLNDNILELSGPKSIDKVIINEGQYSLEAVIVDKAGWSESLDIQFEIDKTAPDEPVLEYENNHTFDAELVTLSGAAEANSIIQIDLNGVAHHGLVNSEGKFIFTNLEFQVGQNDLVLISVDKAGNQSPEVIYTYYRMDSLDIEGEISESGINTDRVLLFAKNSTETTALTSYLSDQELEITMVGNSDQLMKEIRTMSYATLLVGDVNSFNGLINKADAFESLELRSYVANGLNIILLDGSVSFLNLWGDIAGLKHVSLPFKASSVTLDSESIGTLNVQDKLKAYDLNAYSTAFSYGEIECAMLSFICRAYGMPPAFVLNQYSNGRVITFGFDVLDYVDEGKALIAKLIRFITHSNGSNFEYRDLTLLLSNNQGLPFEKDRITISLNSNGNGLINRSPDVYTINGHEQLEVSVNRIDLNSPVEIDGSIYIDDILKDEVSLSLFEVQTWTNLIASLNNEVKTIEVSWFETLAYIKLQYLVSNIKDECEVETCDVRHLRQHVYWAMLKWRISFKDEVKVLERFGEILMYLDYVERKQGAL